MFSFCSPIKEGEDFSPPNYLSGRCRLDLRVNPRLCRRLGIEICALDLPVSAIAGGRSKFDLSSGQCHRISLGSVFLSLHGGLYLRKINSLELVGVVYLLADDVSNSAIWGNVVRSEFQISVFSGAERRAENTGRHGI